MTLFINNSTASLLERINSKSLGRSKEYIDINLLIPIRQTPEEISSITFVLVFAIL